MTLEDAARAAARAQEPAHDQTHRRRVESSEPDTAGDVHLSAWVSRDEADALRAALAHYIVLTEGDAERIDQRRAAFRAMNRIDRERAR